MADSTPVYAVSGDRQGIRTARHHRLQSGPLREAAQAQCKGVSFKNQWRNDGIGIDGATRDRHKVKHEVEDA
jgi:hypothetical protein